MNQSNNDLIIKIRKLMTLQQSSNEHESALAAQRVQELLSLHNLSLAQIEAASAKETARQSAGGVRDKKYHDKSAMYEYQRTLMDSVARTNFCMNWVEERWSPDPRGSKLRRYYAHNTCDGVNDNDRGRLVKTHVVIGRDVNVIATQIMYDYLIETMDRLLPYQGMQKRGKEALLWLSGCTSRLIDRLNDRRREMERESRKQQAETGVGIVLADVYATEDDFNNDQRWGLELGTTYQLRMESRAKQQEYDREQERLMATGMDADQAWYVARGLTPPVPTVELAETESQRRKREEKEERENERWRAKREKERERELKRTSHPAYVDGHSTGGGIGLDDQIKGANRQQITG